MVYTGPMPEYSPSAIGAASTTFKQYLLSTETGTAVWEMLHEPGIGSSLVTDWLTYVFIQEDSRGEFEALQAPPYVDCLKEAVSRIDQNVRLRCKDFETHVPREFLFEHTPEGIQIRRTPENIRDI
jgi:hypothetical protein